MRSKFKWIFTLLVAFTMQFSFAQQKTVTGTVKSDGANLPGATVSIVGTQQGAQTDENGKFSIKASQGDVLEFSFLGKDTKTVTVGASNIVNVVLVTSNNVIDVVVVDGGYRTTTKAKSVVAQTTINSKTIENRPNASFMNTLQGQVAGVNIAASTGQPGAKSTVIIRGLGSINGNSDPLYVIDGFPSNSDNFRSINPNDIASVTVLKDASATSEYGSRGANGVILVKTKKGSFGEPKTTFRYSVNTGISQLQTNDYNYASTQQLLTLENMAGVGLGATLTPAQISAYNVNTDWVDYFFRDGFSSNHQFSVENNSKNLNSFSSVSYLDQNGSLISTGLKRFTLRSNLNGKSANDKFNYMINAGFGFSKNNEATNLGTGAINRNYALGAYISAPYVSPSQYQNSSQLFSLYQTDGTLLYTPLMLIDKLATYNNITEENRINVSTEMSYKINKNLTGRTRTSGELLSNRFQQSEDPDSFNSYLFLNPGQQFGGFEDINQRREFLFNNLWQLDYKKSFGNHSFGANINAEYNYSQLNVNNFRHQGLDPKTFIPNTGVGYLADIATHDFYRATAVASNLRNDLISYFGSVDYDYDSRYGVVGTVRRDGTSRFIGDRQFGNFWSVGARWNIDNEAFMDNQELFQVLKLRGSIGTVGNQRIVDGTVYAGNIPPAFADIYTGGNNAYNNGTGYNIAFGYPELRWETTKQSNIGLDFEMFKSRFRGSADLYKKETIDLFLAEPVSPTSGTPQITKNSSAEVRNSGFELSLAADVIKNENTTLTLRANGSYNNNQVDGIKTNNGKIVGDVTITGNGGSIDEFYVYPYVGVNPANGELLFQAADGTITETPLSTDRVSTGKNYLPVFQGGFGFDFDYKGFFISSTFTFAEDVWRFDFDEESIYDPTSLGQFNVDAALLDSWSPTNTGGSQPALFASNVGADDQSDRFLRDASYIRLRNVQIGYNFPKKFLDRTFLTGASIILQGENVVNFTSWKGFDPESDRNADIYGYPTPRLFTLGVDLKF